MSAILQDVPEVRAAYDEYRRFASDPVMREKIESRERFLTDQYLDRAEALAEGRVEEKIATVRNMKRKGYSVTDIAEITGLPLSEVERLG